MCQSALFSIVIYRVQSPIVWYVVCSQRLIVWYVGALLCDMWIVHYALMTYSRPSVAPILLGITHPDVIYQAKADDDDDGEGSK